MKAKYKPAWITGLIALATASAQAGGMPWVKDYETAKALAANTNRLILIDFFVDGCGWCKKLDATTWQDAQVDKLAERFVPLQVNLQKEGAEIAKKFGVRSHPYLLFVDAKGEVWGHAGYVGPSEFLAAAGSAMDFFTHMPRIQAALKKNAHDGPANCTMAEIEAARDHRDKAEAYVKLALDAGFNGPELAKAFNAIGDCTQAALDYSGAIEWFLKGRAASKNPTDESYSLISITSCYLNKKDPENAKKYAQMLIDLKDGTPEFVRIAKQIVGGGRWQDIDGCRRIIILCSADRNSSLP